MKFQTPIIVLAVLIGTTSPYAHAQSQNTKSPTISAPAQVEPYERADIFAKASGFVSAVYVDIGDTVKKGQLLAELSIPEMEQEHLQQKALVEQADATINQAEARVASAKAKVAASESQANAAKSQLEKHKADIAFAQSELSRITTLVDSRAVNASMKDEKQLQLRSAEASRASAQAVVQSAEAHIQVAQADQKQADADLVYAHSQRKVADASLAHTVALMQYAKIYAPFAGRISHRGIDTADFVISAASSRAKGDSLITLNRVGRFRIVFHIPESTATQIQIGQSVELKVDSIKAQKFTGEIKRTTGELDKQTRTLRVEAEVKDDKYRLLSGMFGTITLKSNRPNAPVK